MAPGDEPQPYPIETNFEFIVRASGVAAIATMVQKVLDDAQISSMDAAVTAPGPQGLTTEEASALLARHGPNEVAERRESAWLILARKLWGPVPWMLEAAIVLTVVLGRQADAAIILALLVFNAAVSFAQENRAGSALALLRKRLAINARVLRDGGWKLLPARDLVPGDVVHVRVGDIVPADLRLLDGAVQLDQSALTGESIPREASATETIYSGSVVQRGEATGEVTATGGKTYFGRTAQLVQTARTGSHLEAIIFGIVRYLMAIDVVLVAAILAYALAVRAPLAEVAPFALILLIASIPAALPATFTIAQAIGAMEMARSGVLVTRLSAIEEAAMMDVLCTDKTGTITLNQLSVNAVRPYPPFTPDELLELAAMASDPATQDPIDLAILRARASHPGPSAFKRLSFTPFDPATKRTEAIARRGDEEVRVVKGMPEIVAGLAAEAIAGLQGDVDTLAGQGFRVLAVAAGSGNTLRLAGLIGLNDPPRPDSAQLVSELARLGIHVKMVTGDSAPTALAVARQVGIGQRICDPSHLHDDRSPDDCDVFAGVYPEDKYRLVRALQRAGHVVGMTGDGVNDAPALKQAEVGTAVATATDVAKAAASMVLTSPGLVDIVGAVVTSRRIYQRMLTYTLNRIIKTFQVGIFLSLSFFLTGTFVTTPFLVVLLIFANDFVTMSIATDRVGYSPKPDRWHVRALMASAGLLSLGVLGESFLVLFLATDLFRLSLPQTQTLVFTMLVFSGLANVYLVRVRRHLWTAIPGRALALASAADVAVVILLATLGLLMAPVPLTLVLLVLGIAALFMLLMDPLKVAVFRAFDLA